MNQIDEFSRPPAVAGSFYNDAPDGLLRDIKSLMTPHPIPPDVAQSSKCPKALIVPHAGYVYSGPVAAIAYAQITPFKANIHRVILLGPCHRVYVPGVALSSAKNFQSPLGTVTITHEYDDTLLHMDAVEIQDEAHAQEHSLEVQIPFLQYTLDDFELLPMVVGDASPDTIAAILDTTWGNKDTLILISSDLSHFLDYDTARRLDLKTCKAIESLDETQISDHQACGRHPLKGLLKTAQRRHLNVRTLDLRNSGDTAGTHDRVVGYGAWALWEPER